VIAIKTQARNFLIAAVLCGPAGAKDAKYPHAAEFRLAAEETLPEVESAQQVIFTDTISGIPSAEGIDRITAPPFAAVVNQVMNLRDAATGASCFDSDPEVVGARSGNCVAHRARNLVDDSSDRVV